MKAGYYIAERKADDKNSWVLSRWGADVEFQSETHAIEHARMRQFPDNVFVVKVTPIAGFTTTVQTRRLS